MKRPRIILSRGLAAFAGYLFCAATFVSLSGELGAQSWRTASREPAGLAPDPATTREAVIQVYAARTVSWRGYFSVHTWIAVKPTNADKFTVYELMGYQTRRTGNGVRASQRAADMYWYGNRPEVLADVRGAGVDAVITRIRAAVADYPYATSYHVWPGPNSNTFTAHVLRAVPELQVTLPANAVGKDYAGPRLLVKTPGGTGAQFSLFGVAGVTVGWREGVEVNVIGLTFGVSPVQLALKLPMIGDLFLRARAEPRQISQAASATQ